LILEVSLEGLYAAALERIAKKICGFHDVPISGGRARMHGAAGVRPILRESPRADGDFVKPRRATAGRMRAEAQRRQKAAGPALVEAPTTEEMTMAETRELVVVMTHGPEDEQASVAFTVANGGMTAGLSVYVFLTGSAVDIARRGATDHAHFQPLEPLASLVNDFLARGGTLWACTPCVKARGYGENDLIEGAVVTGASPMHERIKAGAATLSF
jgi:predicted peroxiredoxin